MSSVKALATVAIGLLPLSWACASSTRPPAATSGAVDSSSVREQARERLRRGEAEEALDLLERAVAARPDDGESWYLYGLATEAVARDAALRGERGLLLLQDAAGGFERAARLLPDEAGPRLGIARVALDEGSPDRALEAAREAEKLARNDEERYEGRLLEARALAGLLAEEEAAGRDRDARASEARSAAEACLALDPSREEGYGVLADVEGAAGRKGAAVEAIRSGLGRFPDSNSLHGRLHLLFAAEGRYGDLLVVYDALATEKTESATVAWYRAEARIAAAHAARLEQRWEEAEKLYAQAAAEFERSASLRPEFGESSRRRTSETILGRAWCRHGSGDLRGAGDAFVEAISLRPDLLQEPGAFGRSAKDGADSTAVRLMETNDLEGGEALLARLTEIVPSVVEWWSNLGYFRWELGRWREGEEKIEEARASYEAALGAYERAREVAPDDPGALNDCVLVLYYHLRRADDRVEEYLRRAIESGEKMLAEGGMDEERRNYVEEATGNAYQNLGVLLFEKKKDYLGAKRLLEKSLAFRPYHRAQARWYIGRVERAMAGANGSNR
jgi:tetratricopeptide (TPR) repeat protein